MQTIMLTCALVLGGGITSDGTEQDLWDGSAVIYCEIVKVENVDKIVEINGHSAPSRTTTVVLKPIATLGGTFDPTSQSTIRADSGFGGGWSAMWEPPADGAKAVVTIQQYGYGGAVNLIQIDIVELQSLQTSINRIANVFAR